MASGKGGFKYLALFFIMAWVFYLGVLVGRGTAPVEFDTEPFQRKLAGIMEDYNEKHGEKEPGETELDFYSALEKPVSLGDGTWMGKQEIAGDRDGRDDKDTNVSGLTDRDDRQEKEEEEIPVIKSRKRMTMNDNLPASVDGGNSAPEQLKKETETPAGKETETPESGEGSEDGNYTVQVAAYRDLRDALKEMAALESKGFDVYKTVTKTDSGTWHRVRTGLFETKSGALDYLEKLRKNSIDGLVIQKE